MESKEKAIKRQEAEAEAAAERLNQRLDEAAQPSDGEASEDGGAPASGSGIIERGSQFPEEVFVIPNYGRPVMPSQIAPVQLTPDWESVLMKVAETKERVFAMFSLGDRNINRTLKPGDFPLTGTLVRLLHAKVSGSEIHFICEGLCRVRIREWTDEKKFSRAKVEYPETVFPSRDTQEEVDVKAYAMSLVSSIQELLPLNPLYTDEMRQYLLRFNQNDPSMLADCAASITTASTQELQHVLDMLNVLERLKFSSALIRKELKAAKLQDKIKGSVADRLNKRQRDFFLREQLSEIQKELGTKIDDRTADAEEFEKRMKKLDPPEHIAARFKEEVKKLRTLESGSPEYAVTRNYLDVLTTIPWGKTAKEDIDLVKAREILDKDHEGLKDVKDRIIEFMAVGALKGSTKGSIILFVGPPGVGKTSIGKSIAKALGRPFFRLSLGGVDDESVIKGHRKTYIGAMPGKIVQALRETGVMNPVIMLDEVDKLSHSYQGDPASALLETLDPEQNSGFLDHYLDEKLDVSGCLFICTANSIDTIPPALFDRMDTIRLPGYIAEEKFLIAKNHLLPRGLKEAHVRRSQLHMSDGVMRKIIDEYARESGVRSLERALNKIIRKAAVKLVGGAKSVTVKESDLEEYLGSAPFRKEKSIHGVGVITGLAWTSVGGATLSIESVKVRDDQRGLELTGQLGDVMKESAQIAYSYIQANIARYAPDKAKFFRKAFIHLHVPEGATPKDGPSAGVTMASSLLSLALGTPPKPGYAMTGELSLTGQVLAIGGLREKTIAARRMGIFDIICPRANEGDVKELPHEVSDGVRFHYADKYDDVAAIIFDEARDNLEIEASVEKEKAEKSEARLSLGSASGSARRKSPKKGKGKKQSRSKDD